MSPLVTLLVLGLLLVVVVALLLWAVASTALGARRLPSDDAVRRGSRRRPSTSEAPAEPAAEPVAVPVQARHSNDDFRGAKAAPRPPRPSVPDDAFERFLRSGRDDDR